MIHNWEEINPEEKERWQSLSLSPGGYFHPAIEQGAQVYHCTGTSNPDLGALRIILRGRPAIPKVQQEHIDEGSGAEQIAPAMELGNEVPKLVERHDSDVKKIEESMQEVMNKKVKELRRELEESIRKESHRELEQEKRRAREEADGLRKRIAEMQLEERIRKETCQELEDQKGRAREETDGLRRRIAEMQSKLEEDQHTSGKAFELSAHSSPSHLKEFLVGPCAHLALQRVFHSTDLHPNSPIASTTHFTARTMNDVSKTSRRVTSSGSLTIWTRHVTFSPPFSLGAQAGQ